MPNKVNDKGRVRAKCNTRWKYFQVLAYSYSYHRIPPGVATILLQIVIAKGVVTPIGTLSRLPCVQLNLSFACCFILVHRRKGDWERRKGII